MIVLGSAEEHNASSALIKDGAVIAAASEERFTRSKNDNAFEARTGIGAVLNTSFNLHGEPIVCNAADAMHTFVDSGLDGLVLPGVLLLKKEAA